ncbi:MAG: MFS transporter [Clostridia bacterium]|nr:MFS transporter [Clostridia bacterium]
MIQGNRIKTIALYASNAMVYAFSALFLCFMPLYFNARFTPAESGLLLSIGPIVSIVTPLFWGRIADRSKFKNSTLIICILFSAVFFFLQQFCTTPLSMGIVVACIWAFMAPFNGLIDAITLEYSMTAHTYYGTMRVMGTIGFGVITLVSSLVSGGNFSVIFYIYVGMAALAVASLLLGPQIKGYGHREKKDRKPDPGKQIHSEGIRSLLTNRTLLLLILCMMCGQFLLQYYNNFFPTYLTTDLKQDSWVWGLCVLLSVSGEIPFFFLYTKLYDQLGIKRVLLIALPLTVLRATLLGLVTNIPAILVVDTLTGICSTMMNYSASTYLIRSVAPELRATGQTLMYCIGQNLARVFAGVVGGQIQSWLGTSRGLFICAGIAGVVFVVFLFTLWRDPSPHLGPKPYAETLEHHAKHLRETESPK